MIWVVEVPLELEALWTLPSHHSGVQPEHMYYEYVLGRQFISTFKVLQGLCSDMGVGYGGRDEVGYGVGRDIRIHEWLD